MQSKSLTAAQDAGNLSSNGGAVLLREAAKRLRLAEVIAAPLPETRNRLLVTHTYDEMVTARMMAIACGHEDADDLDTLRHDPALKIAIERAPESGAGLPSQPTISRLENLADIKVLYRIGINFIDLFCRGYETPGDDTVTGNDGHDVLVGGDGSDTLYGGAGIDAIYTNSGGGGDGAADVIVYASAGWGTDFVFDFEHGVDKIDLTGTGATFANLDIVSVDGHAYVTYGNDLIAVANAAGALDETDFTF